MEGSPLDGVNKPETQEVDDMTVLEKKHTIVIDAPNEIEKDEKFKVTVKVGEYMDHPNEPEHFFEWIELYSGETFLSRIHLTPEKTHHKLITEIKLKETTKLIGRARCNIHGVWEGEKQINIK
ncbi:class II SORL domain-containing protein [Methanonatronarchaeum sp. AMET-Sl]|uniref:class II SORL domain-containing protein n=1 Tax=Methanonatronarchaeum sp. AMET-Sl TaxID=3037654 RepID=UPI00244DD4CA|nr:class II SORL domain-containing protein [Methanonatronarchaeum sp. AMET-Sl]WGI16780.1 class II SORL domain-containing protein [Methanonatronarchaeum sp. AMET-Sl]